MPTYIPQHIKLLNLHSFRHNVVTGTLTLPIMALLMLILWIIPSPQDIILWGGLAATFVTAYLIMELNNRNALLRIRSRMMSVTFLFLTLVCPSLHAWTTDYLPSMCLMLGYFMLFSSYQLARAEGYIFHAFLCLGVGSIVFPPMIIIGVAYYICMLFQLRNFTWRSFMAGILGLLVPYWLYAAYAIWNNRLDTAFLYLIPYTSFQIPNYQQLSLPQIVTFSIMAFFTLLSYIHFFHTAYNDKIRTRMLFYVIATIQIFLTIGIVFLPNSFDIQIRLFLTNSSLLIAHYYALGKGRFFNIWFNLSLILLITLGIFNYLFYLGVII